MFLNRRKINILAFGTPIMLHRLLVQLDKDEAEVTSYSGAAEAIEKMSSQHFDIVLVDQFVKDAEQVCRTAFNITRVPVVVIIQEKFADWKALRKLEVDGYIPDDKGSDELMARIRAYTRRHAPVQEV